MRLKLLFLLLVLGVMAVPAAHAQAAVYASFSGATLTEPYEPYIYGPTFGAYVQSTHFAFLGLGVDARGFVLNGDNGNETFEGGMAGPRLAVRPKVVPLQPYVEVLGGVAHAELGQGVARTVHTGAAMEGLVGLDYTIIPHVDWRAIEYTFYGKEQSAGLTYRALSTGIVLRF